MCNASPLVCLWPGLPRVWYRGDWRALCFAIGFAAVLNLIWVSTFVWPELLPAAIRVGGWVGLFVVWLGAIWHGRLQLARLSDPDEFRDSHTLFVRAQQEYLQGHWYEAESLLRELAKKHERDADCRLMLATLYRRTGKMAEAEQELDRLSRMETAERWAIELARERRFLETRERDGEQEVEAGGES